MCTGFPNRGYETHPLRFNSLQTGKHMCTSPNILAPVWTRKLFQFPSNGKAHVHAPTSRVEAEEEEVVVSIPFKRESTCAQGIGMLFLFGMLVSIPFKRESTCAQSSSAMAETLYLSFNSLQTGKHMCTPFYYLQDFQERILFQFPSNGKAHVHGAARCH